MINIVCIGDSIVKGDRGDSKKLGWVGRLQNKLIESGTKDDFKIYNLGIDGNHIIDIQHRFMTEALLREPGVCIIGAGMNDMLKDENNHHRVNAESKRRYWKKLLEASKHVENVIILSITPVIESDNKELPTNLEVLNYNLQIQKMCAEYNVKFVDLNSPMSKLNIPELMGDEVHPNDKGYEVISKLIYNELKKVL